ncbi:MAG: hypothetical protein AB1632_01535 [Nitrospirota bacterium]
MTERKEKTAGHDRKSNKRLKNVVNEKKESSEDSCRCEEVSKKTLPELLKLMLKDLAFWKKNR